MSGRIRGPSALLRHVPSAVQEDVLVICTSPVEVVPDCAAVVCAGSRASRATRHRSSSRCCRKSRPDPSKHSRSSSSS